MPGSPDVTLCDKPDCNRLIAHRGPCRTFTTEPLVDLPNEILDKIDKTAMTRGAQPYDRVPYQNRVRRWNRAVVPFAYRAVAPPGGYENGSVIMVRPEDYVEVATGEPRADFPADVVLGENAFLYYDNRSDWHAHPPDRLGLTPCRIMHEGKQMEDRKKGSDVGEYLARVPGTTKLGDAGLPIVQGPPQGIRFWEYASQMDTWKAMMQLGFLAWKTQAIEEYAPSGPSAHLRLVLERYNLSNIPSLEAKRAIRGAKTVCPLCLVPIKATELMQRVEQADGREVVDLTITEANLFHLEDLRPGTFGHGPNKLAWGHHHCNAAARDQGIDKTLDWMQNILTTAGRIPLQAGPATVPVDPSVVRAE